MKSIVNSTHLTQVLLAIYLIAVCWILLFKFNFDFTDLATERSFNFIPYSQPQILNGKPNSGELILNVLIFVPLGLYSGVLFSKWNFFKKVILFSSVSFLLEAFQYILGIGAFDITDIINNTFGGIVGLLIYTAVEKGLKTKLRAQKFINIVGLLGTIIIFSFLLFLKIYGLWIFRM